MTQLYIYLALAVFTALCAAYLKKKNPELSLAFGIAGAAVFLAAAVGSLGPIMDKLQGFTVGDSLYLSVPLKILGISILGKLTCSVCEDAGEKGLAGTVGFMLRIAVLLAALPLFDKLLEQIRDVLA